MAALVIGKENVRMIFPCRISVRVKEGVMDRPPECVIFSLLYRINPLSRQPAILVIVSCYYFVSQVVIVHFHLRMKSVPARIPLTIAASVERFPALL